LAFIETLSRPVALKRSASYAANADAGELAANQSLDHLEVKIQTSDRIS
jgi:hypothetical protein